MYIEVNQDGLYEVDENPHTPPKQLTNFVPEITTVYYPLADNQQLPQALDVRITWADHTQRRLILPMSRNLAASIRNAEPRAVLLKPTALAAVQMHLVDQISKTNKEMRGVYLPGNGTHWLAYDQHVTVWNGRVAGSADLKIPCAIKPTDTYRITNSIDRPVPTLVRALLENDAALILPVAYAFLVSRRDVLTAEHPLQGGLYITGVQSSGKTTLARRVFGYTERIGIPGKAALVLEAVSTEASVRDTLSENPGCVVIIDDLAHSSSRTIEAHRKKLGGAMLRLAANEGDSTKKGKTGKTDHRDCTSGIALTAEFVLDGVSELTRSIFVYLEKKLNLTDDVCPALIGAVLEEFADWFADNYEHAIELLHKIADSPDILKNLRVDGADEFTELLTRERRIQDNLALLQWAFVCMVEMIKSTVKLSPHREQALYEKFWMAVHLSVSKQVDEFAKIRTHLKEGNIAHLLCEAIDCDEFQLCRKKSKLFKRNGIVWKKRMASSNRSASSRPHLSSLSATRTAIRTTPVERLPTI